MRKYLAVIKDSFREALASRVLWLLLVGITLFLLAVVPLTYREVVTTQLIQRDLRNPDDFMIFLRTEGPQENQTPAHYVWQRLTPKTRTRLTNVKIQGKDKDVGSPFEFLSLMGVLREELNKQLKEPDFYDENVWRDVPISSPEARDLLKRFNGKEAKSDPLSDSDRSRFRRVMLEAAFPKFIRTSAPTSTQFVYAWMDAGSAQPISGAQIRDAIRGFAAGTLNLFVGVIGVFVAILVTAPIIPQMFDAGSLHLLLSKPVSRWMLFLAKYLGGCAFILICATYLIGGLWLALGVRFGVWEPKLLYSVPIYLFVFAIYYSVSSLAAVIWRSPIVSVAVSILFWLACFVIGTTKVGAENMILNKDRFIRVFFAGESLFGVDEFGWGYEWQDGEQSWKDVFVLPEQRQARPFMLVAPVIPRQFRAVGHVYDASHDRVLAAIPAFPPSTVHFTVGQRTEHWEPASKLAAPAGTIGMFREPGGKILIASSLGLSRLAGDPLEERQPLKIFGMNLPLPRGGPFQSVNPDPPVLITMPADAALDAKTGAVAIYTRGTLHLLTPKGSRFAQQAERKLDGNERQPAVVAVGGQRVLIGRDDGRLQVLDAATLTTQREFSPEGRDAPRFLTASPDGQWFAAVFHTGRLWLYDAQTEQISRPPVDGQGDISGANFTDDGSLLVVDRLQRVTQYTLSPVKRQRRFAPGLGILLMAYRYGIVPLYTVFPKPGEMDKTFDYLLSGKTTQKADDDVDDDLASAQWNLDPWIPLWSSAAFTLVVLLAACVYIEFQEF